MLKIDEHYDVVLMHSPIEEITGHWFEIFEYYTYLRAYGYHPCMLFFSPRISVETIKNTLYEKYSVSIPDEDILKIDFENLIVCPHAVCIVCDGNFKSLSNHGIVIVSKKIYGFGCGTVEYPTSEYKKAIYLLDKRIYNVDYGIHYVKKIYADILKKPNDTITNTAMMYVTKNCRYMSKNDIISINHELNYKNYMIITHDIDEYKDIPNVTVCKPPVKNLFEQFDTYIYTPVQRHFDCSPRFIAECQLFNKNVIYYHIDYSDLGLETRIQDILNNTCWLEQNDDILRIL